MSQNVTIVGPNLPGSLQRLGGFHVHAAGCADLKRGAIRPYVADYGWTIEADSLEAIAAEVYADQIAEHEGDGTQYETAAGYLDDFHFAPCVTLPTNA
jgi:hypothetical protein